MPIVSVNDIHKKFKVYSDKGSSLKERSLSLKRNRHQEHWVLNGVSFEIERGECVGLIGENGCGKSTLLKLMSRIMYSNKGTIQIDGRVSSLIELGAGFHPNMSGRENIYTNAAIFGLSRADIDARLQTIIDFSELGEYIDNPVRTYSSGMYMRLAFSVAINVDADVLLVDEILAVGDANFQAKCFECLRTLQAKGVTIVIVTHDLSTVEKLCTKAIWLKDGEIVSSGKPAKAVDAYLSYMNDKHYEKALGQQNNTKKSTFGEKMIDYDENRFGLRFIELEKVEMMDYQGVERKIFRDDEPVCIRFYYKKNTPIDGYVFGFSFVTIDGVTITGSNTMLDRLDIPEVADRGTIELKFKCLPLLSSKYILQVAVVDRNNRPMDFYRNYSQFEIVSDKKNVGLVSLDYTWELADSSNTHKESNI